MITLELIVPFAILFILIIEILRRLVRMEEAFHRIEQEIDQI